MNTCPQVVVLLSPASWHSLAVHCLRALVDQYSNLYRVLISPLQPQCCFSTLGCVSAGARCSAFLHSLCLFRVSLMPTRSEVHLSSMGSSMHGDSKHPSFQMTVVLLRILSGFSTSAQCAHPHRHSHASFPTSQMLSHPDSHFILTTTQRRRQKKMSNIFI